METMKILITIMIACLPHLSQAQSMEFNCWTNQGEPLRLAAKEFVLDIPDTVAAVDLRGAESIVLNCSSANPNCLFYTDFATTVEGLPNANVVCDGVCDGLLLTDNASFYCPIAFTATDAMLQLTPRRDDGNGESDFNQPCHETVFLPFDADMVISADADGPMPYGWLQTARYCGYDSNLLIFNQTDAGLPKANTPYLVKFAYAAYGTQILFCGQDKIVEKTKPTIIDEEPFSFVGTTASKEEEPGFFRYYRGREQYFIHTGDGMPMEPFRCFIVEKSISDSDSFISGQILRCLVYVVENTGIDTHRSEIFSKKYFDLQGRQLGNGKKNKGICLTEGAKVVR